MDAGMADKIKIIPYSPAHKQAILDLLDSKPFKQQIWEWQFIQNPYATKFEPVILVDRWGTIIGFNGIMPVRIKIDDEVLAALWSCDFVVDSRYQSKGYGKVIKKDLHTRAPLIMALGISDMAARVLPRMGWQKNNIVDSFRKLNRITDAKSLLIATIQLINRVRASKKGQRAGTYEIVNSEILPEAGVVNRLWNGVSSDYRKIVVRDYPYLHWRYEGHPLARYRFISAWRQGDIVGLIVVRITEQNAHLVDYIGPAFDYGLKVALLEKFLSITTRLDYLHCSTSDREWKQLLQDYGFYKQEGKLRFYIFSAMEKKDDALSDWFIMGGDSDGDMLRASEEGPFRYEDLKYAIPQSRFSVMQLTENQFLATETEWNELVHESDADPLFLGWTWQSLWWRQWSENRGYSLYLLGAYTEDNKLVGLAPLYKTKKQLHPLYQFTQIQFIGSSWSSGDTVRTEYLDFIVNRLFSDEVRKAFLGYLNSDDSWGQIIFSDLVRKSLTRKLLAQKHLLSSCYTREVHTDTGIVIDVSNSFTEYLSGMGRNTRYNAFNQRKNLDLLGTVRFDATPGNIDAFLNRLNYLHTIRWGKECFPKESLEFHTRLATVFSKTGKLKLSIISQSNKTISVLYNIRVGHREYNIQAGFDSDVDRKLSPGFLHLGYAIESAFNSDDITEFDLLAGSGKNTFYKSHLGSKKVGFSTLQINRAAYLKCLYILYDSFPRFIKSIIKLKIISRRN